MQKGGREILAEEQQALLAEIQSRYDLETDPLYAAARLWVDGIVDPLHTRAIIATGLSMASRNPETGRFNPGVIQT
jgi:acetyl-CoA carboxylase carboxyltransferase component